MSYCRHGTDSEVYVWHDVEGGWRTDISFIRIVDPIKYKNAIEQLYSVFKESSDDGTIILPHSYAGRIIATKTRKETLKLLLKLKNEGVLVPDRALERLKKEIMENK